MRRLVVCAMALGFGATITAQQGGASGVRAPDGLRANRTTFSPLMDVLRSTRQDVTDEQLDRLEALPLEAIWGALGDYRVNYVRGWAHEHAAWRACRR